jgi:hypothetical protein
MTVPSSIESERRGIGTSVIEAIDIVQLGAQRPVDRMLRERRHLGFEIGI